jgi:hypothetical protein
MDHRRQGIAWNVAPYDPSLDFEADFSVLTSRRRRNRNKKPKDNDALVVQYLLNGIDQEDEARDVGRGGNSSSLGGSKSAGSLTSSEVPRPCSPTHATLRISALKCWTTGKHDPHFLDEDRQQRISRRSHDDYKTDSREMGYSKLERLSPICENSDKIFQKADNRVKEQGHEEFERPPDPPSISMALAGLSFADFEAKAKERAIQIVSTFMHDSGLIDELLVNGGVASASPASLRRCVNRHRTTSTASFTTASSDGDPSVKSSEGVEIGAHGFPIEGSSKMDKELTILRCRTQRHLAVIEAQMSDGKVIPTGGEVQDFVTAVSAITNDEDLGKLQELSTYITNASGGGAERSSQILPPGYPRLSKAINARRNLQRCFRELDFYCEIKERCDRLREELFSSEKMPHEWIVVRNVAREHVDMETLLIGAEAGIKRRIDEQHLRNGMDDNSSRNRARSRRRFGSNRQKAVVQTYNAVDMFLFDKVKSVGALGKEIQARINRGIGAAFQLAMEHPLGMEALTPLVDAVELYETAQAEYWASEGNIGVVPHINQILEFTSVRGVALRHLYQHLGVRGFNVFQKTRQNVCTCM